MNDKLGASASGPGSRDPSPPSGLGPSGFDPSRGMTTDEQCAVFGCDLIDLFRREATHGGIWFGDRLLQAADILDSMAYRHSLIGRTMARAEAAEARIAAAIRVIENGYPGQPEKYEECQHGRIGYEDCIACYDEALLAALRDSAGPKDIARGQHD